MPRPYLICFSTLASISLTHPEVHAKTEYAPGNQLLRLDEALPPLLENNENRSGDTDLQ